MNNFKRIYYKLDMKLLSPLSIGSGANAQTDRDVIVDNLGNPFIPATAIAGVLRSYIKKKKETASVEETSPDNEKSDINVPLDHALFGHIPDGILSEEEKTVPENLAMPTLVRVYDARCTDKHNYYITTRDCVQLENKVAVKGAKFDMEAVEPGAEFTGYIELLADAYQCKKYIEESLVALNSGIICFGSKTSRGYGRVNLTAQRIEFSNIDEWLDFDMFADEWKCAEKIDFSKIESVPAFKLLVGLKLVGGISIREYTTNVSDGNKTMPDYKTMSLHSGEEKNRPVIPGTSWSGAFRDRFKEIAGAKITDELFGFVNKKINATQKSKIVFSESQLSGGCYKLSTRNAIDRFSGATKSGALYTEETYYYGNTTLEISITQIPSKMIIWALGACLADLHNGFLSVGGLTSVGRGLFEITSMQLNGKTLCKDNITEGKISGFVKEVLGDE